MTIKPPTLLLTVALLFALATLGATFVSPQGGTGKENTNSEKPKPTPRKTPQKRIIHSGNSDKDEIEFWDSIKNSADPEDFKAYLQKYPNGKFAILARNRLKKLEAAPTPTPTPAPSPSPGISGPGVSGTEATMVRNRIGMELVWIPPGSYVMGSNNGQPDQRPVHRVTINSSFLIGKYEVTQAQWKAVTGRTLREQRDRINPSWETAGEGNTYPIYYVNWFEAQEFIQKLNQMNDGYIYRLPTEAEWEYACRAGTTADDSGNLAAVAWYGNNSGKSYLDTTELWRTGQSNYGQQLLANGNEAHPVGTKRPNSFGLYDMLGNVYEWCQDYYHPDYTGAPSDGSAWLNGGDQKYRVLRGGSWYLTASFTRPSARMYYSPDLSRSHYGFRVVAMPRPETTSSDRSTVEKVTPATVVRNRVGIDLVLISPGSFVMGSTNGEPNELPVHRVTIGYSFYIGKYEVTQAQWRALMGNNPSYFKDCGGNCPVEQVSWNDAQAFIAKLNSLNDGFKYRLPSEAEWEYACRAGTTGDYYAADINSLAWYSFNSASKTWPVGGKNPNAFGLYDMAGNVQEWCSDWSHTGYAGAPTDGSIWSSGGDSGYRMLRGGSWNFGTDVQRSAHRRAGTLDLRTNRIGFRLVATRQVQ